jgi:arylsulfatase A-like enzyme
MTTLAQKLALVGYHNVLIGKTHWGVKTTHHLPVNRGWHEHIGYLGGGEAYWSGHECVNETTNCNTFTTQLDFWHNARPAENNLLGEYSTTLFTRLAVEVLHNASSSARERLWLHLNYQAVHNPQTSPPGEDHCGDSSQLVFYEVLHAMDLGVGNVTETLKSNRADSGHVTWDETLVIFVSDNGGANSGNNFPYR